MILSVIRMNSNQIIIKNIGIVIIEWHNAKNETGANGIVRLWSALS